jgi:predicted nucleic acid-binding protein
MAEVCVVNASPLIFLSRGGHLPLLRIVAARALVPHAVAEELRARGADDITAGQLDAHPWLAIMEPSQPPAVITQWGLGPGESAVLADALKLPGSRAVIDDLAGRKCAAAFGVPVIGTLGIVLRARRKGVIPAARPVMEDLLRGGMFLSRPLLDRALALVGE